MGVENFTVFELINPDSGTWDEDLINSMFWEIDDASILMIPISFHGLDTRVWKCTKNEYYSFRSAYFLLVP